MASDGLRSPSPPIRLRVGERFGYTAWARSTPAVRLLGLFVGHRARNDHIVALLPIHRRGDLVLRGQLQRVDHAQDLVEIAARRHRIDDEQFDLLVGADDEDVAHGLVVRRGSAVTAARQFRREHSVELRDFQVGVSNHRIVRRVPLSLLDVLRPLGVLVDGIDAEPDDFGVPLVELGFELRHVAELGRAHGREVLRVGEEDAPRVAEPLMEANVTLGRFCLEIRRDVTKLKTHHSPPVVHALAGHVGFTPAGLYACRTIYISRPRQYISRPRQSIVPLPFRLSRRTGKGGLGCEAGARCGGGRCRSAVQRGEL